MTLQKPSVVQKVLAVLLIVGMVIFSGSFSKTVAAAAWDSKAAFSAGTFSLGNTAYTGIVTAEFDVTPLASGINAVIGYADTSTTIDALTKLNALIKLNSNNTFSVMNGSAYGSTTTVSYTANTIYQIKLLIDIEIGKYSVWVKPNGGAYTQIASNYNFQTGSPYMDDLGKICLKSDSDGQMKVDNHKVTWSGGYSKQVFNGLSMHGLNMDTGTRTVEFDVTPAGNSIDGYIGFADSSANGTTFSDYAMSIILDHAAQAGQHGAFKVMNGTAYGADASVTYTAGQTYHIKMVTNLDTQKYDVWVGTTKIANQYSFRTSATFTDDLGGVSLVSTQPASDNNFCVKNFTVDTGTLVFTGDFETDHTLIWDGFDGKSEADQLFIAGSPAPVRQGNYAAKFVVRPGDKFQTYSGERSELVKNTTILKDEVSYFGWSSYFPTDWTEPKDWGSIIQLLSPTSGVSPPLSFDARANSLNLDFHTGNIDSAYPVEYQVNHQVLSNLNKGQWNDFIVKVVWKADYTGSVQVWHRVGTNEFTSVLNVTNVPTLQTTNVQRTNDSHAHALGSNNWYFDVGLMKVGLYRGDGGMNTNTLYLDNFNRGTSYGAIRSTFP